MNKKTVKVDDNDVEVLRQHIWDFCRKEKIFVEERDNSVSLCVFVPCKDFDGRVHYTPINVVLHKNNKKLSNVIFLAHEAGHFLDFRDNPKGWEKGAIVREYVNVEDDKYDRIVSAERYSREKEAWRRGYRILASHPSFTPAIRKKFRYWRRKSLSTYANGYRIGCAYLLAGKKLITEEQAARQQAEKVAAAAKKPPDKGKAKVQE